MSLKHIARKIIKGGFEEIKEGGKQIAQTVSPTKLAEQALGVKSPQPPSEFTKYLQNVGNPALAGDKLASRTHELAKSDEEALQKLRQSLTTTPAHMRPSPKQQELRPYDKAIQEQEQKKALAVEAQTKQSKPITTPTSKQPRGMLGGKRKSVQKGFEGLQKDSKTG